MGLPSEWFRALLDAAPDVYFRYVFEPAPRLVYVSPAAQALTGHAQASFYSDPDLCLAVVASGERQLVRRVLRGRRGVVLRVHVMRDDVAVPVELRTVAVVRKRRVVAVEGVARVAISTIGTGTGTRRERPPSAAPDEPVQQRLAALMFEVHGLLHRMLPSSGATHAGRSRVLRIGDVELDVDRLVVTEKRRTVPLTPREVQLLRYLLERPGRIVTREQLLSDVWGYRYTGDDRTVDVHVSRLRRKLPSLRGLLTAIRQIGYRLDEEQQRRVANS